MCCLSANVLITLVSPLVYFQFCCCHSIFYATSCVKFTVHTNSAKLPTLSLPLKIISYAISLVAGYTINFLCSLRYHIIILPVNNFSWDNMAVQSELNLRRKSQPGYSVAWFANESWLFLMSQSKWLANESHTNSKTSHLHTEIVGVVTKLTSDSLAEPQDITFSHIRFEIRDATYFNGQICSSACVHWPTNSISTSKATFLISVQCFTLCCATM